MKTLLACGNVRQKSLLGESYKRDLYMNKIEHLFPHYKSPQSMRSISFFFFYSYIFLSINFPRKFASSASLLVGGREQICTWVIFGTDAPLRHQLLLEPVHWFSSVRVYLYLPRNYKLFCVRSHFFLYFVECVSVKR